MKTSIQPSAAKLIERDPRIQKILSLEGNSYCADCGNENIKYVGLKFLVILCEKCGEVHKTLGSLLKSLLDKDWNDELIYNMTKNPNAVSREFFEAKKPVWYLTSFTTPESRLIRDYWIKMKYNEQAFIDKGEDESEEKFYISIKLMLEEMNNKKNIEIMKANNWYYLEPTPIAEKEPKQIGPVSKIEIVNKLQGESMDESYYVWHPNLTTWEQIIDVPDFDLENRGFQIVKDDRIFLKDTAPKMVKYLARSLRGYLDVTKAKSVNWKRFWVVLMSDSLNFYKTHDQSKLEMSYQLQDDQNIDIYEIQKEKNKINLAFEVNGFAMTSDNFLEVIEWIHNIKKHSLLKIKFQKQLPLYEDKLNPYRPNILRIEQELVYRLRSGNLFYKFSTSSQPVQKWFELTLDSLQFHDNAKEAARAEFQITKESKCYKSSSGQKPNYFYPFTLESDKNNIHHLGHNREEERQEWIDLIQSIILSKKQST
jgi:hypothetical protein